MAPLARAETGATKMHSPNRAIADPTQLAPVVEVSEVRLGGGLRVPEELPVAAGFSQLNPSPVPEVVRLGQEAMERKRPGWGDWLAIAKALEAGRAEVIRSLHTGKAPQPTSILSSFTS